MPSADRDSLSSATVVPVKLVQIRDVAKTFIGRHTACVLQLLDGCRARLGADAGSLLLHLVDFHHLLLAGFDRHSRIQHIRTTPTPLVLKHFPDTKC